MIGVKDMKKIVSMMLMMMMMIVAFSSVVFADDFAEQKWAPYPPGVFYNQNEEEHGAGSFSKYGYYHEFEAKSFADSQYYESNGLMKKGPYHISIGSVLLGTARQHATKPIINYKACPNQPSDGEVQTFCDGEISIVKMDLAKFNLDKYEMIDYVEYINDQKSNQSRGATLYLFDSEVLYTTPFLIYDNHKHKVSHVYDQSLPSIKNFIDYELKEYVNEGSEEGVIDKYTQIVVDESFKFKTYPIRLNWYDVSTGKSLFDDVADGHWSMYSINKCKQLGLVNGVGDNKYAPNDTLTKAQVLQMLYNMQKKEGKVLDANNLKINDIPDDAWYAKAVKWGVSNGLADLKNNKFNPNQAASREFMCVTLYRMIEKYQIDLPYWEFVRDFSDIPVENQELIEAVKCLQKAEIIGGFPDGNFHPKDSLTRAQAAKILDGYIYGKTQVDNGKYLPQRGVPDYYNGDRYKIYK